jgi:membrane-associated HD superfamily phosphohydrolase
MNVSGACSQEVDPDQGTGANSRIGTAFVERMFSESGPREKNMRTRSRKLIGTIFMVVFVVVYALLAMVLAQKTALQVESGVLRMVIFAVLGLGWAVPLVPLILWMERPD